MRIAFEEFEGDKSHLPPSYQEVGRHIIFDIKMGKIFRRKLRMVAGGPTNETPAALTYAYLVSRDSVWIVLTIAALNDLKLLACDIQNAYLTDKFREKICTIAGPKFRSDVGKRMIVVRALYGLKYSGASFRALLVKTLYDIGYTLSKADLDIWLRPAVKPDRFEYYEMILCNVDDILSISHYATKTMKGIQHTFKLKDDKIVVPENYLRTRLSKMVTVNGR